MTASQKKKLIKKAAKGNASAIAKLAKS